MNVKALVAAAWLAAVAVPAGATTIGGDLTVDNFFNAYISTNDSVLGTLVASGGDWTVTTSFSGVVLAPGVTHYLHVVGGDQGGPEGFIGDFTLSDAGFQFANGLQHINTDTTNWRASDGTGMSSFAPTGTPVDVGDNGSAPWGTRPNIDLDADWIWGVTTVDLATIFFSTTITALSTPPTSVPEPATLVLIGTGLLGYGFMRRRKDAERA